MVEVILEPEKIKFVIAPTFPSSICHEVMGLDAMILVLWMLSIKPAFFSLLFHPYQEILGEQDGGGVGGYGAHLSPWIHQDYTFRHRSACRTPAESRQEYLSSTKECISSIQFSLVAQSCLTLRPHESQHARSPCPSPTPRVYPNSCPSSWWCHPGISYSVVPFSCSPQSLPASGSFPVSQLFPSGSQSIGASALAIVLPMTIQGWFPLGLTGLISL